ncbi:hypothetical protein RclHR1_02920005 [Rhizophagus clarus]|uniref:Kinase-like domain-containing protein n=1 Tax=Rhizophagus clarus TaxID=94130 RepID=A0A2Z6R4X2_9GLOM|nr:hypothetical protein RclHR1_02920005 [Rhizophagus clarus]GES76104.1 kinase-like domain-containing protein [Rhizophagus clarus]
MALKRLLEDKTIDQYDYHDLTISNTIGSGGFASVHVGYWKNASTKYAIKKSINNKEVYLTIRASSHENIIQFRGVTKFEGEKKYSLILEYANGGTLGKYLRNNTIEWKSQLRFAKEIASAICWLHDKKGIIHGDLHPNNVLIHKNTIKLADFGRSCLKGSGCYNSQVWGVIPYVDPKMFEKNHQYKLNEKSDIYSMGVLFWELTSCSSPFDYETRNDHTSLVLGILNGLREKPIKNTNAVFVGLYQKCWRHEPNKRPDIHQVNLELKSIDFESNNVSPVFYPKEETSEKIESEDSDLSKCEEDCDLNKIDNLPRFDVSS